MIHLAELLIGRRLAIMDIGVIVGIVIAALTLFYTAMFGGNSLLDWFKKRKKDFQSRESVLLSKYLKALTAEHEFLESRGIEEEISSRLSLKLTGIYVPPMAKANNFVVSMSRNPITGVLEVEKDKSVFLNDLMEKEKHAVLLGEAGGGKTTFFKYITLKSVENILNNDSHSLLIPRFIRRTKAFPIPLYFPLRETPIFLEKHGLDMPVTEFLSHYYGQLLNEQISPKFFSLIFRERDCLLLLDGLDEIADFRIRSLVADRIDSFIRANKNVRCWISCRRTAYYGSARLGGDVTTLELQPFNRKQVGDFINRWYVEVESYAAGNKRVDQVTVDKATKSADNLIVSLAKSQTLQALASNPLILTAIAIVHYSKMALPERRAELFETCVQALLGSWDIAKSGAGAKTATWASTISSMSIKARRTQLEYIALWMCENRATSASINEVIHALRSISPKYKDEVNGVEQAQDFVEAVTQRGGLFVEYEKERCRFVHKSFQQYLAARRIARLDRYIEYIGAIIGDEWWDEIIRLAASYQSARDPERAYHIINYILDREGLSVEYRLILAAETIVECDLTALPPKLSRRIVPQLHENMINKEKSPEIRFQLGILLGKLGDPRELDAIIRIPEGVYVVGDKESANGEQVRIDSFEITRYPVTNIQFENFIKDNGYSREEFWCAQGWQWCISNAIRYPFYWHDARYNAPNQPVVGVNWFEAKAYATWRNMRLPTEIEWEAAARGPEGFLWPWGNEFQLNLNCSETGLSAPCPVGMFAEGVSGLGVMDMVGNVWEWTESIYEGSKISMEPRSSEMPEAARILRGGSWFETRSECMARKRRWLHPGAREFNFGFRLAK